MNLQDRIASYDIAKYWEGVWGKHPEQCGDEIACEFIDMAWDRLSATVTRSGPEGNETYHLLNTHTHQWYEISKDDYDLMCKVAYLEFKEPFDPRLLMRM